VTVWDVRNGLARTKNSEPGAIQTVEKLVILVVEDEAIIRMSAVDMLEDAGFLVLEAHNADIAVQILESRSDIRAVFTDIEMPGSLCGLRLAKAIRDRWPPIHLIVTSGRYGVSELDLPRLARFIRKPYAPAHVLTALGELLGWGPLPTDISPTQH
jgi:CheY-like chemotaxis protein